MSKFGKDPNLHRDPFKPLRRCASIVALVAGTVASSSRRQASPRHVYRAR
jgi:hypothetical protein